MPRIYNKNGFVPIPPDAVYVGRGSPFGNPFPIQPGCSRGQAIAKYREWIESDPNKIEEIKKELKGKDLVCYCAPAYCHAEILYEIANGEEYF